MAFDYFVQKRSSQTKIKPHPLWSRVCLRMALWTTSLGGLHSLVLFAVDGFWINIGWLFILFNHFGIFFCLISKWSTQSVCSAQAHHHHHDPYSNTSHKCGSSSWSSSMVKSLLLCCSRSSFTFPVLEYTPDFKSKAPAQFHKKNWLNRTLLFFENFKKQ